MRVIELPFLEMWEDAMLAGVKTCTTRSKRYGQAGDRFEAFGATFELLDVYRKTVGEVARGLWREEGCFSSEEFKTIWKRIHPRRGFQACDRKWVHRFRRVEAR
jgi:hypothetical protein